MIDLFAVMKLSTFFLSSIRSLLRFTAPTRPPLFFFLLLCLEGSALFANTASYTPFLKSDGAVWATGLNNYGQLGDGSTANKSNPVQVTDSSGNAFSNVAAIAAGYSHTIFLKSDGSAWATGRNYEGQLGDGSTANKSNPVQITDSSGNALSNVAAIAAGLYHTIFLKSDGRFGLRDTIIKGNWAMGQPPIKTIRFKSQILVAMRFLMLLLSPPDILIPYF